MTTPTTYIDVNRVATFAAVPFALAAAELGQLRTRGHDLIRFKLTTSHVVDPTIDPTATPCLLGLCVHLLGQLDTPGCPALNVGHFRERGGVPRLLADSTLWRDGPITPGGLNAMLDAGGSFSFVLKLDRNVAGLRFSATGCHIAAGIVAFADVGDL